MYYTNTLLNKHCLLSKLECIFFKNQEAIRVNVNLFLLFLSSIFPWIFLFCELVWLTNWVIQFSSDYRFSTILDLLTFPKTKCLNTSTLKGNVKKMPPAKEKQLRYSKVQIILNALVGRFGFLIILYTTTNDTIEFLLKCHRNS